MEDWLVVEGELQLTLEMNNIVVEKTLPQGGKATIYPNMWHLATNNTKDRVRVVEIWYWRDKQKIKRLDEADIVRRTRKTRFFDMLKKFFKKLYNRII